MPSVTGDVYVCDLPRRETVSRPKIALAMIVKGTSDEAPLLYKCLESVSGHVDAIYIDVNAPEGKTPNKKVVETAKHFTPNVRKTVWTGDFVGARNENFKQVDGKYEWILWLDADDVVDNPEEIAKAAAIAETDVHGIYVNYNYAHDEYGNVVVSHYVPRLVRNNQSYRWSASVGDGVGKSVHETLTPTRSGGKAKCDEFTITHQDTDERRVASLRRNIKLLEEMDKNDPRILYYLGTHYYDARLYEQSLQSLQAYVSISGWAEQRSEAWTFIGNIHAIYGDDQKARGAYMHAIVEDPGNALAYASLGEVEQRNGLDRKAIEWFKMATTRDHDFTVLVQRPMEAKYRAYRGMAQSYVNGADVDAAKESIGKAMALRPFDPELKQAAKTIGELHEAQERLRAAVTLVRNFVVDAREHLIVPFLDSLPSELQEYPEIYAIRRQYTRPKRWDGKSIAIYCGTSALGNWGPWSLETGIGGSEEAVIQMSNRLTDLGWKVTVYATPGARSGNYDGVEWKHYWQFNEKDVFDVLVAWRMPGFYDHKFNARKKYLWLHDVVNGDELTEDRIANLDRVIYVSQYHANLYPNVPSGKVFVSGNGVDPAQFITSGKKPRRNPKKVVYMSAHERGQELLQKIWPEVLKAVPEAEAHCYYGWSGYDAINKDNPMMMGWKSKLIKDMDGLQNFTDHGKIGHNEIVHEIQSAGVWAYPTHFPEVYAITAVKAQAGGAWPVYTNYAALKETVLFGDKLDIPTTGTGEAVITDKEAKEFTDMLIYRLKNSATEEQRQVMSDTVLAKFSWKNTALGWHKDMQ